MKSSSLQFQIEKCTRSVFQLDEVYNSCCFKSHWKRIRWQKPIKKLVLLLPQRKIRCATTSLFGVGGSGRRPLEFTSIFFLPYLLLLKAPLSRGLRPLPPTPKREVVAQRILRCGKRTTQALYWFWLPDFFKCRLKQDALYTSSS